MNLENEHSHSDWASPTICRTTDRLSTNATGPMSELTQHDLSALVRDHGPELQHFLTRRLGCADTAKDLVQDTFLRLLQNMPGEILGNPRAFLFRVATNLLIDHHRRQQHRDTVTLDDPERPLDQADQSPSIETVVWSKQQVARLKLAIQELPPKCRHVFLLIKFHHMSHADVAAQLGISQSTVVKHMIKAVDFCRSRLEDP
ncbi:MAG: RNA polymerase sigma factor [Nitrospira sp. NTP2]|nr:RNA polymerase sigma factor [Nitrospira sp. NTP2]RIK56559.1 MAG: RNA polymerase subunit sigma-24 [Nitrospira sp.]